MSVKEPELDTSVLVQEIRASVSELAKRAGVSSDRAFAAWYAINFLDVDEDDALEGAALDGGEDQSIDFLFTDELNERILVLQSHFPTNLRKAAPKAKFDGLAAALTWIEDPSSFRVAGRPELAGAAEEAQAHLGKFETLLGIVSLGAKSDQIIRSLAVTSKSPRFRSFKFFYDSRGEILDRYRALKLGARGVPEDSIRFGSLPDGFSRTKGSMAAPGLGVWLHLSSRACTSSTVSGYLHATSGSFSGPARVASMSRSSRRPRLPQVGSGR